MWKFYTTEFEDDFFVTLRDVQIRLSEQRLMKDLVKIGNMFGKFGQGTHKAMHLPKHKVWHYPSYSKMTNSIKHYSPALYGKAVVMGGMFFTTTVYFSSNP
jgi:hypothetical protein